MVILCVDDDMDDLGLFVEAVREVDPAIVCVQVTSGEEALDFLQGEVFPDHIFMDINMPGMGGIACLAKIRANPRLKKLSVIILSTSTNENDIQQSRGLEAEFISKPNSFTSLVKIVSAVVARKKP